MLTKRILTLIVGLLTGTAIGVPSAPPSAGTGFCRAEGREILDPDGDPLILKGIAFGNNIWGNPSEPIYEHHTESSYKELAAMGFNSVRFYLNYGLFEDDSAPYQYKQSGFDWLDKNIAWAKKYGIGLVLNMHYPQGGYQSRGDGMALWTDVSCQKRLCALWGEIARRYADEPAIIGYGPINEPVVPESGGASASVYQCGRLMQDITDEIRKYDKNHIMFIERVCGIQSLATGEPDWNSYDVSDMLYTIDDDNTVYEFHFYEPFSFTHQNAEWAGTDGVSDVYPSDALRVAEMESYWTDFTPAREAGEADSGGWVRFESDYFEKNDVHNIGSPAVQTWMFGGGTAYFDDITVSEYDSSGAKTRTVMFCGFDTAAEAQGFSYWSSDGSGSCGFCADAGHNGAGCLVIDGARGDFSASGGRFELKDGFRYRISGYVRTENAPEGGSARVRADFAKGSGFSLTDKDFLRRQMSVYIDFSKENNVPLYLGEFGVIAAGFEDGRGGERWVSDMLDICFDNGISFDYHAFHEGGFGLYRNDSDKLPDDLNTALADVFKAKLNGG